MDLALPDRDSITKTGPSSLLPPAPDRRQLHRDPEPLPQQGPSSLLPQTSVDQRRPPVEEVVAVSPSSLLPDTSEATTDRPRSEVVAVSPSELLPPIPTRPWLAKWRLVFGIGAVCAVLLVGHLFYVRATQRSAAELVEAAQTHLQRGESAAAAIQLKNALKRDPDHAEARVLLAAIHQASGEFASAEKELKRALELGYDQAKILPRLAAALLNQQEYQRLLDEIPTPLEGDPSLVRAIRTGRGLAHLGLRNIEEARILFKQALDSDPDYVDALLGNARLAAIDRRLADAEQLIDRALALNPMSLDGLLLKAEVHIANARPREAHAAFHKVLSVYPANAVAHLSLAWLALRHNNLEAAAPHIAVARKVAPNSPQTNYLHALLEFRHNRIEEAKGAIVRALRGAPTDVPTLILAGGIAYAEGNYSHAQQLLLQGLSRTPAIPGARKLYAAALIKQGQPSGALKVLLPTIRIAANDPDLFTLIGQSYLLVGDPASAVKYLEEAVRLRPTDSRMVATLGVSRIAAGQIGPAITALESGLRSDADSSELDSLMVVVHLKQKNIAIAEKYWNELNRTKPNAPTTLHLKGAILAAKQDSKGARAALETALMEDPTFIPAAVGIANLDLYEKDPLSARRRLERLARNVPKSVEPLLALAELGPALKASTEDIRQWLLHALQIDPTAPRAAALLAHQHIQANEISAALAVVRTAQKRHPENAELLGVLGAAQLAAGDHSGALVTYLQLSVLRPRSTEVLFRLSQLQRLTGSSVAASATLRKIFELDPNHPGALGSQAELHLAAGRHAEALTIARRLQSAPATAAVGWTLEGDYLRSGSKLNDALRAYEKAHYVEPSAARISRIHEALERLGREREADRRALQWLNSHPDDWDVRVYLAGSLERRNEWMRAKELYLAAVQLRPNHALTHNNLAWTMLQTGDARARQHAQEAYKLSPDEPAVLDTLGVILMRDGETARGIELLQRAVARAPTVVEPRLHLAQAWLKSGNHRRARVEIEQALSTNPPAAKVAELKRLMETIPR